MSNSQNYQDIGNDSIVVAGDAADGHGVQVGHRHGTGPMTMERYTELRRRAGIPDEWALPAKGAKTQLTRAVEKVAATRRLLARQGQRLLTEVRPYAVRWLLIGALAPVVDGTPELVEGEDTEANYQAAQDACVCDGDSCGTIPCLSAPEPAPSDSLVGQAYGTILLQVTLYDDPAPSGEGRVQSLHFAGDVALADLVRAQYDANVGSQLFDATDITGWLNRTYKDHCQGVMNGPAWYVPREHRATAEAITEAFASYGKWGTGWYSPPLPCATSRQLGVNMAQCLCEELGFHLGELQEAREEAAAKGQADITARRAEGFAIRLAMVKKRIDFHARTLGDAYGECVAAYDDAMITLDAALEGGATTTDGGIRNLLQEKADAEAAARSITPVGGSAPTLLPVEERVQYSIPFADVGVEYTDERTSSTEVTELGGYL